jgi:hypothetical protein
MCRYHQMQPRLSTNRFRSVSSAVEFLPYKQAVAGSIPALTTRLYGSLAQLVERFLYTENVGGSNPSGTTKHCVSIPLGYEPGER